MYKQNSTMRSVSGRQKMYVRQALGISFAVLVNVSTLQAAEFRRDIKGISTGMTKQDIAAHLSTCKPTAVDEWICPSGSAEGYSVTFTRYMNPNVAEEIEYSFCSKEPISAILDKITAAYELGSRADVRRTAKSISFTPATNVEGYFTMLMKSCEVDESVPQYLLTMTDKALKAADQQALQDQATRRFPTPGFN